MGHEHGSAGAWAVGGGCCPGFCFAPQIDARRQPAVVKTKTRHCRCNAVRSFLLWVRSWALWRWVEGRAWPVRRAQSADVDDDRVLGHSVTFNGPASQLGLPLRLGAQLHFDAANAKGGINGRLIETRRLDDGGAPERCAANTRQCIQANVFALFGCVGTAIIDPFGKRIEASMRSTSSHSCSEIRPESSAATSRSSSAICVGRTRR